MKHFIQYRSKVSYHSSRLARRDSCLERRDFRDETRGGNLLLSGTVVNNYSPVNCANCIHLNNVSQRKFKMSQSGFISKDFESESETSNHDFSPNNKYNV